MMSKRQLLILNGYSPVLSPSSHLIYGRCFAIEGIDYSTKRLLAMSEPRTSQTTTRISTMVPSEMGRYITASTGLHFRCLGLV
jgi:hypothetical protein